MPYLSIGKVPIALAPSNLTRIHFKQNLYPNKLT